MLANGRFPPPRDQAQRQQTKAHIQQASGWPAAAASRRRQGQKTGQQHGQAGAPGQPDQKGIGLASAG
jgi:hypothetical protein